jgi:hypothetical protein
MNVRITIKDNIKTAIIKLAEGNPGALTVMLSILEKSEAIDPDAALGPMAHIFGLDTLGIYGPRIWMLYKDVCKQDLVNMLAVLRAVQLGKLSESVMNHAIDNYGEGLDLPETLKIVQTELPDFGKMGV